MRTSEFFTTREVLERFNITKMAFWRWRKDDALGFPAAFKIRKRKYYRKSEVIACENAQQQAKQC